ncbi:MAG TPA: hypothetical protein VF902_04955, partial [Coriobacteriia bacterium]
MIVQLTRFVFATAGALAGLAVKDAIDWTTQIGFPESLVIVLFVMLGCSIGFILGGILGRELTRSYIFIEDSIRTMSAGDLLLGTSGLLVGLVIALITSQPIRMLQPTWVAVLGTVSLFAVLGYFGLRLALIKRKDFGRLIPRLDSAEGQAG